MVQGGSFLHEVGSGDNDGAELGSKLIANYVLEFWWLGVPFFLFDFIDVDLGDVMKVSDVLFNFDGS